MAEVRLVIDGAAMEVLLNSPFGPVGLHLIERATVFQMAARRQVNRVSGCLQDSIVKRVEATDTGFAIRVMADTQPCSPDRTAYSLYVHEGTRPHVILPKKPGGVLAWQGADGPVFATRVNHPGTAPNRFFTDNFGVLAG